MLIKAEEIPTINLSSPLKSGEGDGYTIEEDSICIKTYSNRYVNNIFRSYFYIYTDNRFILTGTNVDKTIIIQSSSFIYLDSVTLTSKGTTIIIEENCQVDFILRGKSSLINSVVNENMGNIYLKEGAKLKIYGQGILNLIVNKFFGLYSESNSSLEIVEGTLKIISTENSVGGIYIDGDIYFNNHNFYYEALSGINPVIVTNGTLIINSGNYNIVSNGTIFNSKNSIIINSGNYNIVSNGTIFNSKNSIIINSGNLNISSESGEYAINIGKSVYLKGENLNIFSSNGIGIHAEENIYLGIKDEDNNNLRVNLTTFDKGLEAQRIEIFSGNISIKSENDGIGILNDYCNENTLYSNITCYIKIYDGEILINSEKNGINSVGNIYVAGGKTIIYAGKNYHTIIESKLLKITNGIFFAGGSNGFEENNTETTQTFKMYKLF